MNELNESQEAEAYRRACWQMMLDRVGTYDKARPQTDTIGRKVRTGQASSLAPRDSRYAFNQFGI